MPWTHCLPLSWRLRSPVLVVPLTEHLARRIGAIDVPRERSLHVRPTPKLGGLAILAGGPRLGDHLASEWRADDRDPRRRGGDRPLRRHRRRLRAARRAEAAGPDDRRDHPRAGRRQGRLVHPALPRPAGAGLGQPLRRVARRRGRPRLHPHRDRDRRGRQRDQLHRRHGRARGRRLRDLRGHARDHRALARPPRGRRARRAYRRRRARLPPPRLSARLELHGRHRLEPARLPARLRGDPGRPEDDRGRRALLPARRPRDPDPRHRAS